MKFRHKLATACFIGSNVLVFALQPNYQLFLRYCTSSFENKIEKPVPVNISDMVEKVYDDLHIQNLRKTKIDVFISSLGDVTSLGTTATNFSYAFLGVPFHCCYKSREDIPKDFLKYLGNLTDLDLDRYFFMSEKALKFVLAREIVKLNDITCQFVHSTISTCLLTSSIYVSYLYTDNMLPKLRNLGLVPSVIIASITFLGIILMQQQIVQTLLRKYALRVDQLVVGTNPHYLEYGKEYYKWRINFNKLATFIEQRYQNQPKNSEPAEDPVETEGYFLPEHLQKPSVNFKHNTLCWRYTPNGNEVYAADGNMCGLGLGSLLALGAFGFNNPFTSFMRVLYNPATSNQRLNALNTIKTV